jgi:hypothetical protein
VLARQALLVSCSVLADVLGMGLGQLLNGSHDGLQAYNEGNYDAHARGGGVTIGTASQWRQGNTLAWPGS